MNIKFNLNKVHLVPKKVETKEEQSVTKTVSDKRYVIYRHMGVAGRVLLFVFDKWEGRYVFQYQAKIEKGYEATEYVKSKYRGHKFIDNIADKSLIEF